LSKLWLLKQVYTDIIRVAVVGVLLIFALIISINSFSWYSYNQTVSANSMSISIKNPDGFGLQATSYFINHITESGADTIYTVAADTESPEKKVIPTYDLCNIAYNEYEKALALKFTITAFENADANARLTITTETALGEYNFLSNYAKVALVTQKDAIANSNDFNLAVDSYQSFVTVSNNELTKNNTLTFDIDLSSLQDMQFYIVITYDEDVIRVISEEYSSGNLPELNESEITCVDDITYELLKVEE
jgi:hypothetical protein